MSTKTRSEFEKAVSSGPTESVVRDFWHFFRTGKKWWLVPFIVVLVALGLLTALSNTAIAPFIYTLF